MNRRINLNIIFISMGIIFLSNGCVTKYLSDKTAQPYNEQPAWADQSSVETNLKNDTGIEYANPDGSGDLEIQTPSSYRPDLIYDHMDKSIGRLTDYSLPRRKIKSNKSTRAKKRINKKSNVSIRRGIRGTDRIWGGNDTVNIHVNNTGQEPQKTKPQPKISVEPLSRLESKYNQFGELTKGKKTRQFGYDLIRYSPNQLSNPGNGNFSPIMRGKKGTPVFSQDESTRLFAKSKNENASFISGDYAAMRPVSSEYIMAPGDEVYIKITGPIDIAEVFSLDRNGQLFLPKIGTIHLAGKTASQLQSIVTAKTKTVFKGAYIEATLGRLRSIQVTVTGNVQNPGLIEVMANSSLLNALAAAGGPAKNGTLRKIQLRRRDSGNVIIDLYSVLMDGDFHQDPALLPGDVIYVGPVGPTVAMISPGDKGAIFEILEKNRLKTLADMAGITGSFTDINTVLVEKNGSRSDRKIASLDFKNQAVSYQMSDGDIFQFFPPHSYSYNSIIIQGPVLRPGAYPYSRTMKVSDLLKLSKGFLVNASLDKALLIRELGVDSKFNIMPGDSRGKHRKQLIWLDLEKILAGEASSDIILERLDRLKIFTVSDTQPEPLVKILGGVRKPGEYNLTANMTLSDLLEIAGGPTPKAYDGESSIVRRRHSTDGKRHFDVKIISFNLRDVISRKKSARILLKNNDKIVIRQVNNLEVSVKISGWAQFPGTYILPSGSRINDLVKIAGGILPGSDLRGAVFTRRRVSEIENKNLKRFYASSTERFARIRDEVTLKGHPSESFANQLSLLGQDRLLLNMKKFQTTGRVVIDLTHDEFPDTDNNMILEDGDSLTIPQKMTTVMVMGRVFNPSAYLWKEGLSVDDYLEKSGGYLEDADKERVYVVMANGEVKSAAQKGGKSKLLNYKPNSGDIVFVPQETLGRSTMAQIMDVLQVIRAGAGIGALGAAIPNMENAAPSVDLNTDGYQNQNIINEYSPEMFKTNSLWNGSTEE